MRVARILIATLSVSAGVLAVANTAEASPSCVAQGLAAIPPGAVGPAVSGFARNVKPLGATVSWEATSPKDDCPAE